MKRFVFFLLICISVHTLAQTSLPIDTLDSKDAAKPLLFYLTGDGGFNSFSKTFMQLWNTKGYPVVALNARSYFWSGKKPGVAASEVYTLLNTYMNKWKRSEVILAGYSLGADILPFIITRLNTAINNNIKDVVLISPSSTTDFEVHLVYGSGGESVENEINKLGKPTLVLFGSKEKDTPEKNINNKNVSIVKLAGDHHYNNNVNSLVQQIIMRL